MTSNFLKRAAFATSNKQILQRATSATSNEWFFATSNSARNNEQILQRVTGNFTTSEFQRVTSNEWKVTPPLISRSNLSPSREWIIEALETFLTNNNSTLVGQNLIQTNETAIGAANSCSY